MILFYGRLDDAPLRRAVEAARESGVEHLLIEQRLLARHDLVLHADEGGGGGCVVVAGTTVPLGDVRAAYLRPLEVAVDGDVVDQLRARTFHAGLMEWADATGAVVINRPTAMESNSSKPFQAQLIARAGFAVPETLVTSEPELAAGFRRQHGRVIYKSVSGVRSIVRELDDAAAARLDRVRSVPTMFQAYVPGVDVRVHVVGSRVFATEITSASTDYRYAARDGNEALLAAVELPEGVAAQCVQLSTQLHLPLCGIDLRRRPDGRWVCFEVNPMPAYSYYEANTGQPIAQAIVELCAERRPALPLTAGR